MLFVMKMVVGKKGVIMKSKVNQKQSEKDTRPVRCYICKRKMYYFGHPKHEAEWEVVDSSESKVGYIHLKCIRRKQ